MIDPGKVPVVLVVAILFVVIIWIAFDKDESTVTPEPPGEPEWEEFWVEGRHCVVVATADRNDVEIDCTDIYE